MAAHRDKESLLEEIWNLKKALQAARESNRLLTLQNKHMVTDLKNLEEHVIDLQSAKRDQWSPLRGGSTSSSAEQSALVARLKQQAREIKSQQIEIASELAQVKGSTRAHRFREIEEENRALYAEIKRLTDALRGQKALFEKERSEWKRKVEGLEKRVAERRPLRREPARGPSPACRVGVQQRK
ncbi:hypothetical protein KFL_002660070 [Klebsormidium nitens]|uniref:Uncharacterized protein n=1 Tax=Klebsormidium nitens TaxID=105231 RepID=A0A1Y1IBD3_KLENI|nr:hypothetical protein KFL_002660070 [Klebsormidium nitens]|eukprot:GAQ86027.1 hypothetical protein KFL_002660070 [Klebsormidium nitens]